MWSATSAIVVALVANTLASPGHARPSPIAQASRDADADRHSERRPERDPTATPVADAAPDRHARPDPGPRPGAADRPDGDARRSRPGIPSRS